MCLSLCFGLCVSGGVDWAADTDMECVGVIKQCYSTWVYGFPYGRRDFVGGGRLI